MALVDFDTISLSGAVTLLEYVASVEQQDAQAWPDFVDDAGKCHDWHYFFLNNLAAALTLGVVS
jgi:hypothetical protein